MDTSMESVRRDGRPCGALVRRRSPREVSVFAALRDPDGTLCTTTTTVALPASGALSDWTQVRITGPDGEQRFDRADVEVPDDTVPTALVECALDDMLASSATDDEGHVVDDLAAPAPRAAHLVVGNPENVHLPDGREEALGTVELVVDDEPRARYWFDSHHVVVSERDGLTGYRVESVEDLVDGLDDQLAAAVRAHCG